MLKENEFSLIDAILDFITCDECGHLEQACCCLRCEECMGNIIKNECQCDIEVYVQCDERKPNDELFICNSKCKGDVICEGCSDCYKCVCCEEEICENCMFMGCDQCGVFCVYCESEAVCYCEDY